MKLYQIIFLTSLLLSSASLFAENESFNTTGTRTVFISQTNHLKNDPNIEALGGKYITIETTTLTPEKQRLLAEHLNNGFTNNTSKQSLSHQAPDKISLGMNHIPVLDQGAHGTCTTFSITAAIDAVFGEDFISQLCYLELTDYLSQVSSHSNGWQGNHFSLIMKDLTLYGIISKSHQKTKGCAGVYEYPVHDRKNIGKPMHVSDYTRYSKKMMDQVKTELLLSDSDAFSKAPAAVNLVSNVKKALERGNRVLISMLLDINYRGGVFGSYKNEKDAWILTPEIKKDILFNDVKGKHGLVVTGYDDKAVITGPSKTKHQGVFTVRNSWGSQVGDHGDYYVSYEYFHALVYRANEILSKKS